MTNTTVVNVSGQQYTLASQGAVSLSEGRMTNLVVVSENFLTIYTGTFWGPVTVSVRVVGDENAANDVDRGAWEAIEEGQFHSSAVLQIETNDGTVWSEFTELATLPPVGMVAFTVLARGRAACWGKDITDAAEEHLIVLRSSSNQHDTVARSSRSKSDGRNTGSGQKSASPASSDVSDTSDARVRTMGPYVF